MDIQTIRRTEPLRHVAIARFVAAAPLLAIGAQHLLGSAPLLPILRGTPIPFPELNAVAGSVTEVVAGLLLASGAFARIGAVFAVGAMAVALFTHATFTPYVPQGASVAFTWPDEPPILLPLVVLAASLYVLARGAGSWSVDAR